jgi:UDPglucose--hexose-1-phosphate uridylyltransferase
MFAKRLVKDDGRALWLYGREPISDAIAAVSPPHDVGAQWPPNPHMRWHPLRREWVTYAGHRQTRTFLPPPDYNPLAQTRDLAVPTELPAGNYDVAVFENKFPTLHGSAHDPPNSIVPTLPARGSCEVVVFTQDSRASLGALPLRHVELIVGVWAHRYRELAARDDVAYVFAFENRGVEVGVTLHHPHGQIYAYPFVPAIPATELAAQADHFNAHGSGLLADHIRLEQSTGERVVDDAPTALAFVPVFARYAYEVWVAPKRAASSFADLTDGETADLARCLKSVLLRLDGLWQKPMPYILAVHQAPTDGSRHPEAHLHIEIYPAYRMPNRLKYLAGSEIGAGAFTADTIPEEKAAELRAVEVEL